MKNFKESNNFDHSSIIKDKSLRDETFTSKNIIKAPSMKYDLDSTMSISSCKICHEKDYIENEIHHFLISPCKCEGTMKYIHEDCLKKWLTEKYKEVKTEIKCEICDYEYVMELEYSNSEISWMKILLYIAGVLCFNGILFTLYIVFVIYVFHTQNNLMYFIVGGVCGCFLIMVYFTNFIIQRILKVQKTKNLVKWKIKSINL